MNAYVLKQISQNIVKPLVIFDTETTGTDTNKDEIVQICAYKIYPNNKQFDIFLEFIKPSFPIPKEASDIHGITNDKVKNCPAFSNVAKEINEFFKDSDVAGFNIKFDLLILSRQLETAGEKVSFYEAEILDSFSIFKEDNTRTLSDAYKYYTGNDIQNAHDAQADVLATAEIIQKQLEFRQIDVPMLAKQSFPSSSKERVGFSNEILIKDGVATLNISKQHKGKPLNQVDQGFLKWMLKQDFPQAVKNYVAGFIE